MFPFKKCYHLEFMTVNKMWTIEHVLLYITFFCWGEKKIFFVALAELNEDKPQEKNHIRKSQTFDGLCDYLRSEGKVF